MPARNRFTMPLFCTISPYINARIKFCRFYKLPESLPQWRLHGVYAIFYTWSATVSTTLRPGDPTWRKRTVDTPTSRKTKNSKSMRINWSCPSDDRAIDLYTGSRICNGANKRSKGTNNAYHAHAHTAARLASSLGLVVCFRYIRNIACLLDVLNTGST